MIRIGYGKDIHRFSTGRRLILGGVEIPYEKGLAGHSDADVLCHAIADALLGAGGLDDIGTHFPDTDMQYKDISSLILLKQVYELISNLGWRIVNIDTVVVLQKPKIAPFRCKMIDNIAHILKISTEQVSIKATTPEGLGFEGASEGITAEAVVLLEKE